MNSRVIIHDPDIAAIDALVSKNIARDERVRRLLRELDRRLRKTGDWQKLGDVVTGIVDGLSIKDAAE